VEVFVYQVERLAAGEEVDDGLHEQSGGEITLPLVPHGQPVDGVGDTQGSAQGADQRGRTIVEYFHVCHPQHHHTRSDNKELYPTIW
jgi:hypothetical protein